MFLPEAFHRHWGYVEPAALGVVSIAGSALAILAVPEAVSPQEYGSIFVGFLIFLGLGVMGMVGFTATYIAKAVVTAVANLAGDQSKKVMGLPDHEELESRFQLVESASVGRAEKMVAVLTEIQESIANLGTSSKLLNQRLEQQVDRTNENREDIRKLEQALYTRRNGDTNGRPA